MPTLLERIAIVITGDAIGGVNAFKAVGAANNDMLAQMSLSQRAVGALGTKLGGLSAVTVGLGADVAALKFGEHLVNEFADATAAVRSFQRVSGASAETSSELVAAFKVLGVDSDRVGTAMFRLAHNIDGSRTSLEQMGVAIAKNSSGAVDLAGTFLNIADAVQRVGAGFDADRIIATAFGTKIGKDLLPVLLRGRENLQELFDAAKQHHEIFSQSDLEKGRQFTLATNELHQALVGLEIEGGKALIPLATAFAKNLEPAVNFFGIIARGVEDVHSLNRFVPQSLGGDLGKSATAQVDLASAAQKAAQAMQAESDAADANNKAQKDLTSTVVALVHARESQDQATRNIAKAQQDEKDAVASLNQLLRQGAVDATAVASAQRSVRDATRGVADAIDAQSEAQQALDKVKQGSSPRDIRKAQLDVVDSARNQQRAILGLAKAQDDANSIVAIGVLTAGQQAGTTEDLLGKQLDLADATEQIERASLNAGDAQDALTKLQEQGKDGSDDLKEAQKRLDGATRNVADAQQRQTDTQGELAKALAGDPDFQEKVRKARQDVADATQHVSDQQLAARDSALQLAGAQDAYNTALSTGADLSGAVLKNFQDIAKVNQGLDFSKFLNLVPQSNGLANPLATLQGVSGALANPFGGGAAPQTNNFYITGSQQPWQTALAVQDVLAQQARRNGK